MAMVCWWYILERPCISILYTIYPQLIDWQSIQTCAIPEQWWYIWERLCMSIFQSIWLAAIVISVKVFYKKHSAWYVDMERIITAHLTSLQQLVMQVFSEKVSLGSVGSATGSATGSVGSVEGTKIAIYGAGSVGSVATMGMVARLRNIGHGCTIKKHRVWLSDFPYLLPSSSHNKSIFVIQTNYIIYTE